MELRADGSPATGGTPGLDDSPPPHPKSTLSGKLAENNVVCPRFGRCWLGPADVANVSCVTRARRSPLERAARGLEGNGSKDPYSRVDCPTNALSAMAPAAPCHAFAYDDILVYF